MKEYILTAMNTFTHERLLEDERKIKDEECTKNGEVYYCVHRDFTLKHDESNSEHTYLAISEIAQQLFDFGLRDTSTIDFMLGDRSIDSDEKGFLEYTHLAGDELLLLKNTLHELWQKHDIGRMEGQLEIKLG